MHNIKFACEVCNKFETHKAAQLKKHKGNERGELNALLNCTHCNYKSAKTFKLRDQCDQKKTIPPDIQRKGSQVIFNIYLKEMYL